MSRFRNAEARVDLGAIRDNVAALRDRTSAEVMAVVKADGYGHGLMQSALAAMTGGATWLGTALVEEALALRAVQSPLSRLRILTWLSGPGERWGDAIRADIDVSASAVWAVEEIAAAARDVDIPARLHLKADTGLSRGGAPAADWADLVDAARKAEADGVLRVVGLWSHLAYADAPGHPTIARQAEAFLSAVETAERVGVRAEVRHLANSAATLTSPEHHFDLVRPGIAVYGLSPVPDVGGPADFGLRPAMTLSGRLVLVKRVPAGSGVSYGHTYVTDRETTVGLLPLGYADGIPRNAGNVGPLLAAGHRRTIAGRVCMDQVVVDLGDDPAAPGDEVVLFGTGEDGGPTAQDWAEATGTISYEIVSRIGPRVPRVYAGETVLAPAPAEVEQ
ncbi:MAG: alanine racemase [Actinomycetota bacterium]|jgi:alanine racemase|nr:alanine racemase [Actinomycetota bacterium]